jgi:hypothetical protein
MKNAVFWDVILCGFCKKRSTSIIKVTRIGKLGTTLDLTSNRRNLPAFLGHRFIILIMETLCYSETPVITSATQRNIPEDGIFQQKPTLPQGNPLRIILFHILSLYSHLSFNAFYPHVRTSRWKCFLIFVKRNEEALIPKIKEFHAYCFLSKQQRKTGTFVAVRYPSLHLALS